MNIIKTWLCWIMLLIYIIIATAIITIYLVAPDIPLNKIIEEQPYFEYPENKKQSAEMILLARCIFAEAAGEGKYGMTAVGCVIRNRVKSNRKEFGNKTYSSVILKKWQFSCVNGEGSILWNESKTPETLDNQNKNSFLLALRISSDIIEERQLDITAGAVFYMTHKAVLRTKWINSPRIIKIRNIGSHAFFKYDK